MIFLYIVLALIVLYFAGAYAVYRYAFARGKPYDFMKMTFSPTNKYTIYRDLLTAGVEYILAQPFEEIRITADDGIELRGRYIATEGSRGMALLFHGWHSLATNDFSCAVSYLRSQGLDVLLADQRSYGESGGRVSTFGVMERRDCAAWCRWAYERFPEKPLIIEGISMGASTVMMATALPLPETVRGVIADCGFTSPRAIIEQVAGKTKLPKHPAYVMARVGAKLFGGFDPEDASALEAMKTCTLPCLFVHGDEDGFVPCDMSRQNYAACAAPWKKLVVVRSDQHGFAYVMDTPTVQAALLEFLEAALKE